MAKVLPDHQISRLLGKVIMGADETLLNPNGIELRLGSHVLFQTTEEERELSEGQFLQISPGEVVTICSLERLDFSAEAVRESLGGGHLMGIVTPTTTMMREGVSQLTTKVDPGFHGLLNWAVRNGSPRDVRIGHGEAIFKLTLFLLSDDESPDSAYGERERDAYQGTDGIRPSGRKLPAHIPRAHIVSSSFAKIDHRSRMAEAGYPFNHISTEFVEIDGKLEVLSKDAAEMRRQIEAQTSTLSGKMEELRRSVLEQMQQFFQNRAIWAVGIVIAAGSIGWGSMEFLRSRGVGGESMLVAAAVVAALVLFGTFLLTKRPPR